MTRAILSVGCYLFLAAVGSTVIAGEQAQADFYVSVEGNDQWSGTLPPPGADGKDGPFATLERARDAVRQLRCSRATPAQDDWCVT